MKKILALVIVVGLCLGCVGFSSGTATKKELSFSQNSTPPNELGIAQMLIKKGIINKNSTPEQIDAAVNEYIKNKLTKGITASEEVDKQLLINNINANIKGNKNIKIGNMVKARKKGKDERNIKGVQERSWDGEVREAKLLILLAEFGNDEYDAGPLHNQIAKPPIEDNSSLWVSDFSSDHYKNMLFTEGGYDAIDQNGKTLHLDSMVDYYKEQSGGSYKVNGNVYGWFTLPHSEAYYGDDDAAGGNDNKLPGTPKDLVADLLKVARETVPFENYDIEDPMDLDSDGDIDEPDGIIDHLVIVHAGIDQSGGGGAQSDNAIWAHSSSVFESIPSTNPTVPYWGGNMIAYNYIIQGEDGAIGVFCHEFGHDLGLPDEYDTIYSGNGEPVGFYSLMSSGSWTGKPLGTKPAPMSPWARITLGQIWGGQWVQPTVVSFTDITESGKTYKLDQTTSLGNNNQVVKVTLPPHEKVLTLPYEGANEFYGGKGDEIDNTLTTDITLPQAANISLDFSTWYNIEEGWDFGFVQVSTDGGATWKSLSSNRTTSSVVAGAFPAIIDNLPGYTGSSNGWVNESIDLSQYAGQNIKLQFRYMTDWGTSLEGFFVDNLKVTADGSIIFQDNAENGIGNWVANGWSASQGYELKSHYYLIEWRNHNKTDIALKYGYNLVDSEKGIVEYYESESGALVWYRDTAYDDNWVGVHPGHGFLGIVDAHPAPSMLDKTPLRTRLQIRDAAFSLDKVGTISLTLNGKLTKLRGKSAEPTFNDSRSYWSDKAPHSGIIVPEYGLKFKVLGNSRDYTVGEIGLYK